MILLAIAIGGGTGAVLRHVVNHLVQTRYGADFPRGIFVVNALGCLAIGFIAGLIASARVHVNEPTRAFIFVGVLGGFTTFSSMGLDTFTLARGGQFGAALVNAVGQLVVGLAAVWAGYALGATRL